MRKQILCRAVAVLVVGYATSGAQTKVGTVSTAMPISPSVTANGMAGIGMATRGESDFIINPALLGFFDRAASVGAYPVWAKPYQMYSEPRYFAASGVVGPSHLLRMSASRLQFSVGASWQQLKYDLYEVTYEGITLHKMAMTTRQAALGVGYRGLVDVGIGLGWRHLTTDLGDLEQSANSYDVGAVVRAPLGAPMPIDRSWSGGPLYVALIGSAVWTGYGPDIKMGASEYSQVHGRRYGIAAELAYRWLRLCPAVEREATPGYTSTVMRYGGELALADILSLRAGKIDYSEQDVVGDDQITFGFGLSTRGIKRLIWPQADAGSTEPSVSRSPWWRRFDLEVSFAAVCDASELVYSSEFYELRLTY